MKRALAIILTAAMLLSLAPLSGFMAIDWPELHLGNLFPSAKAAKIVASGNCGVVDKEKGLDGSQVKYTLDEDGTLTIRGKGDIGGPDDVEGSGNLGFGYIVYNLYEDDFNHSGWEIIKNIKIEKGITKIGYCAFDDCSALTSVTISSSVTSIDTYAFSGCSSLKSITIPNSVTSIGSSVFEDCYSLTTVTLPNSVKSIGGGIFSGCSSLKSIKIPDGVTSIEDETFAGCGKLASVTIPQSVTSIGWDAFFGCENLTSIKLPNKLEYIGYEAFANCTGLKSLTIPDSVKSIGSSSFDHCEGLSSVTIGKGVTTIEEGAFSGCTGLKTVTIGKGVTTIEEGAFSGCAGLKTVTIPDKLTTIESEVFSNCTGLVSVTIPLSVKNIEEYSFAGCSKLKHVYYAGTKAQWKAIDINDPNQELLSATIHYNSLGNLIRLIIDNNSANIKLFAKKVLSVIIDNPQGLKLIYSSSDPSVLSVAANGVVTATGIGTAIITAMTEDGKHSSTCEVTVTERENMSISFKSDSISLNEGETKKMTVTYFPKTSVILWKSSNPEVVAIDDWGNISAKKTGSAVITATIKGTKCSATIKVTVNKLKDPEKSISKKISLIDKKGVETGTIDVSFDPVWFADDSEKYNHNISVFSAAFSTIGYYNEKNYHVVSKALEALEFSDPEVKSDTARDEQNYFIAHKTIRVNGVNKELLFVGLIGSHASQWYSDFDPIGMGSRRRGTPKDFANPKIHLGFLDAKNYMTEALNTYIDEYLPKKGVNLTPENTILLLTGHSRGASAANLMAADAIKGALGENNCRKYANLENIYAYTFAGPNAVYSKTPETELRAEKYDRIYNIINPEDFVTWMLPAAWHYGRYGQIILLPSKTNCIPEGICSWRQDDCYDVFLTKMRKEFSSLRKGEEYSTYYGEEKVYSIVNTLTSNAQNVDEYYHKSIGRFGFGNYTFYDYFTSVLVPFAAEEFGINISTLTNIDFIDAIDSLKYYELGSGIASEITSFFIENQLLNPLFAYAHMAETYYAYMKSMQEYQIVDANGKIIERKSVYYKYNCPVDLTVIDKKTGEEVAKIIDNVADENNQVVTEVTGDCKTIVLPYDGQYEIVIEGNDNGILNYSRFEVNEFGQEVNRVNYYDVPVENEVLMMEDTVETEDGEMYTAIFDQFGEEVGVPTAVSEEEFNALTVTATVEGLGYVSGDGHYTIGDYVTLDAATDENNSFLGFYENSKLITKEATYSFVIKENKNLTAKFTDKRVAVTGVKIEQEKTEYDLAKDETVMILSASVLPANATDKGLVWSSSDESVATVTENGVVELLTPGKVTLTASTPDGKHKNAVTLTITDSSVKPGDADGDGKISAADARLALRASVGLKEPGDVEKDSAAYLACDVDGDGKVTSADARLILRASVGLEDASKFGKKT